MSHLDGGAKLVAVQIEEPDPPVVGDHDPAVDHYDCYHSSRGDGGPELGPIQVEDTNPSLVHDQEPRPGDG